MAPEVTYLTQSGRLLRFVNQPGLYPVNEYQSLVLAAASEMACIALATRQSRSLEDFSAWEPCCGGGPAAVTLKNLGLSFVQASDINEDALAACRKNAELNDLRINRLCKADILKDASDRIYDLICCNPPCGVDPLLGDKGTQALWQAVAGGNDGMDFTLDLLRHAPGRLTPRGSLVFTAVSTGNIARLANALDEHFPLRWRVLPCTPVAAPWLPADDRRLSGAWRDFEPFIWKRPDGWFWRLSWVVEASMASTFALNSDQRPHSGFPLHPFGYEVEQDPALCEQIGRASRDGFWLSTP